MRTAVKDGEAKGREEGRKEERQEIAKAMKNERINVNTIAKITGLTIAEIENI